MEREIQNFWGSIPRGVSEFFFFGLFVCLVLVTKQKTSFFIYRCRGSTLAYMLTEPGEDISAACYVINRKTFTLKHRKNLALCLSCIWVPMSTISCQLWTNATPLPLTLTNLASVPTPLGHCVTKISGWIPSSKSQLVWFTTMVIWLLVILELRDLSQAQLPHQFCWRTG